MPRTRAGRNPPEKRTKKNEKPTEIENELVPVGTALSGRPPDRTRRADFPHRAPTFGLRQSETLLRPGVNDAGLEKRVATLEAFRLRHVPVCALAPPMKLAVPGAAQVRAECDHRSLVAGHSIVLEVPAQDAREPRVLRGRRIVPASSQLLAERGELRYSLLSRSAAHEPEPAALISRGDVREAEKVERRGLRQPFTLAFLVRVPPEEENSRLVRM